MNLHENQSDKPESQKKKQRKSYKKLERAIPHELSAVPPNIIIPEMQSAEKILGNPIVWSSSSKETNE